MGSMFFSTPPHWGDSRISPWGADRLGSGRTWTRRAGGSGRHPRRASGRRPSSTSPSQGATRSFRQSRQFSVKFSDSNGCKISMKIPNVNGSQWPCRMASVAHQLRSPVVPPPPGASPSARGSRGRTRGWRRAGCPGPPAPPPRQGGSNKALFAWCTENPRSLWAPHMLYG